MNNKKRVKYTTGSLVTSYIENPAVELQKDSINKAKAKYEGDSNPWALGLQVLAPMLGQLGSTALGSLAKDNPEQMATGGLAGVVPIEAEDEEIIQVPGGPPVELEGATHAEGGIDLEVPENTAIFSSKFKGPDGKTFADRKKAREKEITRLQKLIEKSPGDKLLKKTLDRVIGNNEKVEQGDMAKMQMLKLLTDVGNKFVTGGLAEDEDWYKNNSTFFSTDRTNILGGNPIGGNAEKESGFLDNLLGSITTGDAIGMAGNAISTFGPMLNTQRNRAGDTPNINPYENYGQDGLEALNQSKEYIDQSRNQALGNLELDRNAAIKRGRNSARSVNTMRALDLATDQSVNKAQGAINTESDKLMAQIFGQEAQMENDQDRFVMRGEQERDIADRQDRDNYFSQMAQDISTQGTGLQKIGKDVNAMKTRDVTGTMLNEMFDNFGIDLMTGKAKGKSTEEAVQNSSNYNKIKNTGVKAKAYTQIYNNKWKWDEDGNLVDVSSGKQIDLETGLIKK